MKYFNCHIASSLFSSFQENTKCESSCFADTCTHRVPIFKDNSKWHLVQDDKIKKGYFMPCLTLCHTFNVQSWYIITLALQCKHDTSVVLNIFASDT
jgi:hypothetical protein